MRRISLALALIGAAAATGCGKTSTSNTGGNRGVADGTFRVTIQNGQNQIPVGGVTPLAITGGYVTSDVGGIDCGEGRTGLCEADVPAATGVTLTAHGISGNVVAGWAGDCLSVSQADGTLNTTCKLTGASDKYVVVAFGTQILAHANLSSPLAHEPMFAAFARAPNTYPLKCTSCHGATLGGTGLAVACVSCHQQDQVVRFVAVIGAPLVAAENCASCHPGAGAQHQALYNSFADGINPATTQFAANIVSVVTTASATAGKFKSTVTFTLLKNGTPFTAAASTLKQKTMYFVSYDAATKTFTTNPYVLDAQTDPTGEISGTVAGSTFNFSYGSMTLKDAATGTWTMVKDLLNADPNTANANAFVYGYFGDKLLPIPVKPTTHYALLDNMVSVAKVVTGAVGYTSTATVSGCEKCHGAPYSKHGYRQATVAGLNDFVACKACHTDQRRGTDAGWYLISDNPAAFAAQDGVLTFAQKLQYAYTANVMQDTHNSHAFEFQYPQTMANCTTCHEGKLALVITDANFKGFVCKSCHPTTNTLDNEGRAPSFKGPVLGPKLAYHDFDWSTGTVVEGRGTPGETRLACNACHADNADMVAAGLAAECTNTPNDGAGPICNFGFGPTPIPLFGDIHSGLNSQIYKASGTKYNIAMQVGTVTYDAGTKKLTILFTVTGSDLNASALVKPTVVVSLYGWNTKDFVVSGHGSAADGKRNLEWTEGATNNSARLTVDASAAGKTSWTAVADLSSWAADLTAGSITKAQVAILPVLGVDQTAAVSTTAPVNPAIAVAGTSKMITIATAAVADAPTIVDAAKCNKCHDALGTTFHSPSYGSATVVGCRVCHWVGSGGSHLEMQSRSIDSYVHSIHTFQAFDIKDINFADPVAALEYTEHIDATYPNFTTLSCESCHVSGTYDAPANDHAMPAILSASATLTGKTRAITGIPYAVTGPAAKACGGCHRAEMINEDDANKLNWFNSHTGTWGYRDTASSSTNATSAWKARVNSIFDPDNTAW